MTGGVASGLPLVLALRTPVAIPLFGVAVRADISWLLGLGLATWTLADGVLPLAAPGRGALSYVAAAAATAVLLLLSVALHEAGHCLAAHRAGLPVTRLTLSLVGGTAELGASPRSPAEEARVAAAGPVATLLGATLAAVFHVVLEASGADPLLAAAAAIVAAGNLFLAALNLLPGLPLDGGRLLRAALWALTGHEAGATRVALHAGRGLGAALLVLAVVASASGDTAIALWSALLGFVMTHGS